MTRGAASTGLLLAAPRSIEGSVMANIPVDAESPSAATEPRIVEEVAGALVSWHPERGWNCSATGHHVQPCEHTAGLIPAKHPEWRQ